MACEMARPITPVGYARYSTVKQTENSIGYQKDAIRAYCKKHNLSLLRFYTDEAASATNLDRQGLQTLIRDAEQGFFDSVIIYDISRGSRDVADWFAFRKAMAGLGVRVISVNQELGDLTDPSSFIKEALEVSIGQYEVLQARQKSIAGVHRRAQEGVFLGGIPPLGYDVVDGYYVISAREAQWVRIIFRMYADGKSYNEILDELKKEGAVGKRGRPLGKSSLRSILTNERYIGVYFWNKRRMKTLGKWAGGKPNPNVTRIEDAIPRIIEQITWERVQKRLNDNKRNAKNSAKRSYLLSGKIECESCGGSYIGRTSTNSRGYESSSYVCNSKYRTRRCTSKNVNAAEIESFVVQGLNQYLHSAEVKQLAKDVAERVNRYSPDLRAEKKELAEIEAQLHNGVQAVLSGASFPELQDEMDRLRVRKSELDDIIARAESSYGLVDVDKIEAILRGAIDDLDAGNARRAVELLVTKIYAHADGSCTVNMGVSIIGCGGAQQVIHTTYTFKVA